MKIKRQKVTLTIDNHDLAEAAAAQKHKRI